MTESELVVKFRDHTQEHVFYNKAWVCVIGDFVLINRYDSTCSLQYPGVVTAAVYPSHAIESVEIVEKIQVPKDLVLRTVK